MSPFAIVLSFLLSLVALGALGDEIANVRADGAQTAIRYADQLLPGAMQAFATAAGNELATNESITSLTTTPAPVCPTAAAGCWANAAETVTLQGTSVASTGTDASANINANAGEERLAALATVTITDPSGNVLAQRSRIFTLRTYDAYPYASVVDTSGTIIGSGTADADIAGCTGNTVCGDNTVINSYVACNDQNAPNTTAQGWENDLCTQGLAPVPTATPTTTNPWNELETNNLANSSWSNANATVSAWHP